MTETNPVASTSDNVVPPTNEHPEDDVQVVDPSSSTKAAEVPTAPALPQETKEAKPQETQETQEGPPKQPVDNPEWGLKEIIWPPEPWEGHEQHRVKIITQNLNGPCSFIAICNILLLRGAIKITPPDRRSASYDYLSMLVGDYLVNTALDVDIASVFSVLPKTQFGLDLNPLFTGISSFRPAGAGGELKLFELAGIKLVHGWLADPDSHEYAALSTTEDYDTSIDAVVAADTLTHGQLVYAEGTEGTDTGPKSPVSEGNRQKIEDALLIRHWLDGNPTQLTYYGLFALNDSPFIEPNELVCFFRSSHLNVLYKRRDVATGTTMLYTLVTDRVFLREPSVVWETLVDVDGQASSFVDSYFVRSTPVGGDYAGQTSEQVARAYERREEEATMSLDAQLAHKLQLEEDAYAQRVYQEQLHRREAERQQQEPQQGQRQSRNRTSSQTQGQGQAVGQGSGDYLKKKKKDKGDCIIM